MAELVIEPGEGLSYDYVPAAREGAPCFCFVNPLIPTPLTPDGALWAEAASLLEADGYGTLRHDFRGVGRSRSRSETELEPGLLVSDLRRLLAEAVAEPVIMVGLGFGGLIAAGTVLEGQPAAGLVLINSLLEVGPRLGWVAAASPLLLAEGGAGLQMDALLPLLVNPDYLQTARSSLDAAMAYQGLPAADARINLSRNAAEADWTLPLEDVKNPTLVITGLQDRVFLDREVVNAQFARLPDARAEAWEDAGHLLPAERPQQLARSLVRFARELDAEASAGESAASV